MPKPTQLRVLLDPALRAIPVLVAAPCFMPAATLRSRRWFEGGGHPADRRGGVRLSAVLAAVLAVLISVAAVLRPTLAIAQSSSASYHVPRQSIDGGKARISSASYVIEGTIGQPDAAPALRSGSYELRGGFHRAAALTLPDPLFSNGFE